MKKMIFSMVAIIAFSLPSVAKDVNEKQTTEATVGPCCTATLLYNGQYYDHQTSCSTELTYEQNCAAAQAILLNRNPAAKKALSQSVN